MYWAWLAIKVISDYYLTELVIKWAVLSLFYVSRDTIEGETQWEWKKISLTLTLFERECRACIILIQPQEERSPKLVYSFIHNLTYQPESRVFGLSIAIFISYRNAMQWIPVESNTNVFERKKMSVRFRVYWFVFCSKILPQNFSYSCSQPYTKIFLLLLNLTNA